VRKKHRVAVMIDLQWPYRYHQDVFVGVQRYAQQTDDWDCQLDPCAHETLANCGKRSPYDGVVGRLTQPLTEQAARLRLPSVNVWLDSPIMTSTPSVVLDQRRAGVMAAEHLLARGLQNFGYVGFPDDRNARWQWEGFRARLQQSGFSSTRLLVQSTCSRSGAAWTRFQEDVRRWVASQSRPLGIFVIHDLPARYLSEAMRRMGWGVPNDAALIAGYNEPAISAIGTPTITGIGWSFERLGFLAAKLLDQLMRGKPRPTAPQLVKPLEIVVRQSTDVFAVDDPLVAQSLRYISEHSHEPIQVNDVTAAVYATRRSLERRFRNTLGRTIAGEITRLRIERVKRLLVETDLSIKSLATQSGFGSAIQMCKVFRRFEDMSPGAFREMRR
jgi:LacI family transcriptional regulator